MATLSVVLSAYNDAAYLPDQLTQLAAQSRPPDEYVLLDDGSTDGTGALLAAVQHPRVQRLRNATPSGPAAAYQQAVAHATSDWLFLASANDVVLPGAFAAWAAEVPKWPSAVLMAGDLAGLPLDWAPSAGYLHPRQVRARLSPTSILHGAGIFVQRAAWAAAGGYDPALRWLADMVLYHTLALRHGVVVLTRAVSAVRPLPTSYSGGYADPTARAAVVARLAGVLGAPDHADVRDAFLGAGLVDIPEAGDGAVRALLEREVAV